MTALETAVDKLENVRIAIQNGKMPKHAGLFDLPSLDRSDVIMAYIAENPEAFDDCAEDIESALLSDIAGYMAKREFEQAARIMALAMANTPAGGDILQSMQERAEAFIHDREVENRYEETRLEGAVVYYMK